MVATVACAAFVASSVRINTDTTDMLSAELPFRQEARALRQAFPQTSDNLAVVVEGRTADLAEDAARALSAAFRAQPAVFGEILDPASDPFFRQNGLLFLDLEKLYELGDRLAEAQPFLGALWQDRSLRGLFLMLERLAEAKLDGTIGPDFAVAPVFDRVAAVGEAQAADRFGSLSWRALMEGDDADGEARQIIVLRPPLDFASLRPAATAMSAIRRVAADQGLGGATGVSVRLTGSAALNHEELASVERGLGIAGLISLTAVLLLLTCAYRSWRLVAATLVTLVAGLIWTAAFAVAALPSLNLLSVAFAVLFIGLSVDFGIHYALRYDEARAAGLGRADGMRTAVADVGGPLALTALTAAIGFYAFLPTDYVGLAELGLIAGTGMLVALVANITVLPALLSLGGDGGVGRAARVAGTGHGLAWMQRHARSVTVLAVLIGIAAVPLLPEARFDFDPLNLKDRQTESVATLLQLIEDDPGDGYAVEVLAPSLDAARALAGRVADLEPVGGTRTVADFVPADQDAKLDVIATLALILEPSLLAPRKPPPTAAEVRDAFGSLAGALERLAATDGDDAVAASRLSRSLTPVVHGGDPTALDDLGRRLLGGFEGRIEALREALTAEPFGLDDLPANVRALWLADDGRARLEIRSEAPVHRDRAALERFVSEVQAEVPRATGTPVVILEAGRAVVRAFIEAGLVAVGLISLLLVVLLRRVDDVLLVFAPLVLAAVLTVAASAALGMPFNFANVIVLPLLFGLGVAGALHMVLRDRSSGSGRSVMATSTPRAVVFSALTTIGSFASLGLSSHPGTASMGKLLAVAIFLTMVCTLCVLPALMTLAARRNRQDAR